MKRISKHTACLALVISVILSVLTPAAQAQQDYDSLSELIGNGKEIIDYYLFIYADELNAGCEPTEPATTEPATEPTATEPSTTVPTTTEPASEEPNKPMATEPTISEATEPTKSPTYPVTEPTMPPTEPTTSEPVEETTPDEPGFEDSKAIRKAFNELSEAIKNADDAVNNGADEEELQRAYIELQIAVATAAQFHFSGDVNLDGKLNVKDVTLVQKYVARTVTTLSDLAYKQGDVNYDGKLTIKDATKIQQMIAGVK